jgi:hypothetical protein
MCIVLQSIIALFIPASALSRESKLFELTNSWKQLTRFVVEVSLIPRFFGWHELSWLYKWIYGKSIVLRPVWWRHLYLWKTSVCSLSGRGLSSLIVVNGLWVMACAPFLIWVGVILAANARGRLCHGTASSVEDELFLLGVGEKGGVLDLEDYE